VENRCYWGVYNCASHHLVQLRQERALVMADAGRDSAWEGALGEWVTGVSALLKEL
jgi:hypothetical protein